MSENSVFTKIIKGELPASKVYEDDIVIAIMALHAVRPGHTLVIPKEQIDHFHHLSEDQLAHIMKVAKRISHALEEAYDSDRIGMSVIGYEVPHAHLHLIPLSDIHDITFKKALSGELKACSPEDLAMEADKIKAKL